MPFEIILVKYVKSPKKKKSITMKLVTHRKVLHIIAMSFVIVRKRYVSKEVSN